jgi:hypothetical protein
MATKLAEKGKKQPQKAFYAPIIPFFAQTL